MIPEVTFIRSRPYDTRLKHFEGAVRPDIALFRKAMTEM